LETYVAAKNLVHNPHFSEQRQKALIDLDRASIDEPISDLITRLANLPYCFTLQSCYGHFLLDDQSDPHNVERLPTLNHPINVEYRIAYLAVCVKENQSGRLLIKDLSKLCLREPQNIQYGSAEWFWERQINSYVVQVEPERHQTKDRCVISYQEALHLERVRDRFFNELDLLVEKRVSETGGPPSINHDLLRSGGRRAKSNLWL
jgi:hypothetical protein